MTTPSTSLSVLLENAGFQRDVGADRDSISQVQAAFGVRLPDDFAALWAYSDGMVGDGINLLPLALVEKYSQNFVDGFGWVPFADCNDSNPYAICCHAPLQGIVAHVFHDDEPVLICHGLNRFLELVAEARKEERVDYIEGDFAFDNPYRTDEDAATAQALIVTAQQLDHADPWWGECLRFAAQLLGVGHENELAEVLSVGDEYTREAVRRRWTAIGTPEATKQLQEDAAAYQGFLVELQQAFEAAEVRTEPYGAGEFLLQPGNVGLNFAMLFALCRQPGAMAEWVQRFKDQLGARR